MPFPDKFSMNLDWRMLAYVSLNGAYTPLNLAVFDLLKLWMFVTQGLFVFFWIMASVNYDFCKRILEWIGMAGCFGGFKGDTSAVPLFAPGFLLNLLPSLTMPLLLNFISNSSGIFSLRKFLHECADHEKARVRLSFEQWLDEMRSLLGIKRAKNAGYAPIADNGGQDDTLLPLHSDRGKGKCKLCWQNCWKYSRRTVMWLCYIILSFFLLPILPVFELVYLIFTPLEALDAWMSSGARTDHLQNVTDGVPKMDGSLTGRAPAQPGQQSITSAVSGIDGSAVTTDPSPSDQQSADAVVSIGDSTDSGAPRQHRQQSSGDDVPTADGNPSSNAPRQYDQQNSSTSVMVTLAGESSCSSAPTQKNRPNSGDAVLTIVGSPSGSAPRPHHQQGTDAIVPSVGPFTPNCGQHYPQGTGHAVSSGDGSTTCSPGLSDLQNMDHVTLCGDRSSRQSTSPDKDNLRYKISQEEENDLYSRCRLQFIRGVWRWYYVAILLQFTTAVVIGSFHCNRGPLRSGASTPLYVFMEYAWNGPLFASLVVYTTITEAMHAVCTFFPLFEDHHRIESADASKNFEKSGIEVRHLSMDTIWRYDKLLNSVNHISEGKGNFGWVILVQLVLSGGAIILLVINLWANEPLDDFGYSGETWLLLYCMDMAIFFAIYYVQAARITSALRHISDRGIKAIDSRRCESYSSSEAVSERKLNSRSLLFVYTRKDEDLVNQWSIRRSSGLKVLGMIVDWSTAVKVVGLAIGALLAGINHFIAAHSRS